MPLLPLPGRLEHRRVADTPGQVGELVAAMSPGIGQNAGPGRRSMQGGALAHLSATFKAVSMVW